MSAEEIRKKLARIDELRKEAAICGEMNAHWIGHDGELVELQTVTVRRRWRSSHTVHSEFVMDSARRDLFLEWLELRGRTLNAEARMLETELETTSEH